MRPLPLLPLHLPLLLLLAALALLPQQSQQQEDKQLYAPDTVLTNTECNLCTQEPPVTKCTNCEKPIRAKSDITSRCSGTLTCMPGRILIANNRFVVTDVKCSPHSSEEEEVWTGKTSVGEEIFIENAACFITPISCVSLGSFSTRCPRGFKCKPVQLNAAESEVFCYEKDWKTYLRHLIRFNVERKSLWFQDHNQKWQQLSGDLRCDSKIGAWVENDPVNQTGVARSIITNRLICGQKEFDLLGTPIELELTVMCVTAIHICMPILLIAGICIYKQRRTRANLRAMKKYLDNQYAEGKKHEQELKAMEKVKMQSLTARWRQVNKFVVEKNLKDIRAYQTKKKKGRKASA